MFKPIDISKAALAQTGSGEVVCSEHLWSWRTKQGHNIDLNKAAATQFGPAYQAVATGNHAYDWAAFNQSEESHIVIPIMQVASELFFSVGMVRDGLARFYSAIGAVRTWYLNQVGKTFKIHKPLVQYSGITSSDWAKLQNDSLVSSTRYNYLDKAQSILNNEFKTLNPNAVYLVTQYCGERADLWLGAANRSNVCVVPPRCCSVWTPALGPTNELEQNIMFAIGHELGHAFGLPHPDQLTESARPQGWQSSIMQWGYNGINPAILTTNEKTALITNPYFRVTT
jgi:hypothetical protein